MYWKKERRPVFPVAFISAAMSSLLGAVDSAGLPFPFIVPFVPLASLFPFPFESPVVISLSSISSLLRCTDRRTTPMFCS